MDKIIDLIESKQSAQIVAGMETKIHNRISELFEAKRLKVAAESFSDVSAKDDEEEDTELSGNVKEARYDGPTFSELTKQKAAQFNAKKEVPTTVVKPTQEKAPKKLNEALTREAIIAKRDYHLNKYRSYSDPNDFKAKKHYDLANKFSAKLHQLPQ